MADKLLTPEEKRAAELQAHINLLLRRVDAGQAESIITRIYAVLKPSDPDEPRVKMETAIAALSAVLAGVIMQAPRKQRELMQRVFTGLLTVNLSTGALNEAITAAAEEASASGEPASDESAAESVTRH